MGPIFMIFNLLELAEFDLLGYIWKLGDKGGGARGQGEVRTLAESAKTETEGTRARPPGSCHSEILSDFIGCDGIGDLGMTW